MKGIIFRAPVKGFAGYTVVARNLLKAVNELSPERVSLEEIQWVNNFSAGYRADEIKAVLQSKSNKLSKQESELLLITIPAEFAKDYAYSRTSGYCMFETDSLPSGWVKACNSIDRVFVPTAFNKKSFAGAGVKVSVEVVPLGVNTDFFSPAEGFKSFPETFNFLSVSQVLPRKGNELIISAFLEVFGNNPEVSLLLRWFFNPADPHDQEKVAGYIKNIRNHLNIHTGNIFLVAPVEEQQLNRLYNSANALLAPFRGEGWSMPVTEALACEIPVIATNWGGVTEYLTADDALLLDYKLVPVPQGLNDHWLRTAAAENHNWAEPDYNHLKTCMREIYEYYPIYKVKAKKTRRKLNETLQWKHSASKLLSFFD